MGEIKTAARRAETEELLEWAVAEENSPGLQSSTVAQLHCLRVDNFISSSTKTLQSLKNIITRWAQSLRLLPDGEKKKKNTIQAAKWLRRSDRGGLTASYPCEWRRRRRRRRTRRVGPGRPRPGGSGTTSRHQLASTAARRGTGGGEGGALQISFFRNLIISRLTREVINFFKMSIFQWPEAQLCCQNCIFNHYLRAKFLSRKRWGITSSSVIMNVWNVLI